MPSKDPEVRRETWRRWAKKNRTKNSEAYQKYLARKAAAAKYPELQPCSIESCEETGERHHPDYTKRLEIVWLCKTHHEAEHHKEVRRCYIEECDRKHHALGFCNLHLKRHIRGTL